MAGAHLKQRYPSIVMPFIPPEGDEQRIRAVKSGKFYRFLYSFNEERDANRFLRDYTDLHGLAIKRKTGPVWSVFAEMRKTPGRW